MCKTDEINAVVDRESIKVELHFQISVTTGIKIHCCQQQLRMALASVCTKVWLITIITNCQNGMSFPALVMREADHKTWLSIFLPPIGFVLRHAFPRSEYSTIFLPHQRREPTTFVKTLLLVRQFTLECASGRKENSSLIKIKGR